MLADFRWMTRVVDASAAVAARGFPAGLEVEVPLRLRDTIVTTNQADYVLSVQKGRG
jgi:predicted acetyltransferase